MKIDLNRTLSSKPSSRLGGAVSDLPWRVTEASTIPKQNPNLGYKAEFLPLKVKINEVIMKVEIRFFQMILFKCKQTDSYNANSNKWPLNMH